MIARFIDTRLPTSIPESTASRNDTASVMTPPTSIDASTLVAPRRSGNTGTIAPAR
jgi:hypothetical protein